MIPVIALISQSLALSGDVAFRIGPVIVFQLLCHEIELAYGACC